MTSKGRQKDRIVAPGHPIHRSKHNPCQLFATQTRHGYTHNVVQKHCSQYFELKQTFHHYKLVIY